VGFKYHRIPCDIRLSLAETVKEEIPADEYASGYEHNPLTDSTWTTMERCEKALRDALVFGKTVKYGKDPVGDPYWWKWSKGKDGTEKIFRNTKAQRERFLKEWQAQHNIAAYGSPNAPTQQQQVQTKITGEPPTATTTAVAPPPQISREEVTTPEIEPQNNTPQLVQLKSLTDATRL
jgi:hypothetical protein